MSQSRDVRSERKINGHRTRRSKVKGVDGDKDKKQ